MQTPEHRESSKNHGLFLKAPSETVSSVLRFSSGCLRWLSSHDERFRILGNFAQDGQQPTRQGTSLKVIGEVGLMLMVCGRAGPGGALPHYGDIWLAFSSVIEGLQRPTEDAYSNLRLFLNIVLALEANGKDARRFRDLIALLLRRDLLALRDLTPWGILAVTYFLDLCGIPHAFPSGRQLYEWSILRSKPALHSLTTHDKYALSHLLFFLSDFGANNGFFRALPDHQMLVHYLDELTASCLVEQDWDLLGEFLIGYECVGAEQSPTRDHALDHYLACQKPGGEIELPLRVKANCKTLKFDAEKEFEMYYHQTLVAVIFSALYLRKNG
jgi:hypothetical protein